MESVTELFEAFDRLVVNLNADWRLHKELFQAPENYILFYDSGPLVWHMLRDSLIDSVFISIARMLDRAKMGAKQNLSLAQVILKLEQGKERNEIQSLYEKLEEQYDSALRDSRNRRIGHNDLLTATGVKPLPEIRYDDIEMLVIGVNKIAEKLGHVVQETHKSFVPAVSNQDWVWRLMETLKAGIATREADLERRKKQFERKPNPETP